MFRIEDGRINFYQWDINRRLIIDDPAITHVHFCNRTDDCSLVCDVYTDNGVRVVDVPNILLQTDWRINVYAYDKSYTKHCSVFNIVARTKPADYVYTETEIHTWEQLAERVAKVESNNSVDLSDYYTKDEVDLAIDQIEIPDVSGFATKEEIPVIPANVSAFNNDVGYQTEAEVLAAIQRELGVIENGSY